MSLMRSRDDAIDEKLNFLEVDEAPPVVFGDGAEEVQDLARRSLADTAADADMGMAKADFVALA